MKKSKANPRKLTKNQLKKLKGGLLVCHETKCAGENQLTCYDGGPASANRPECSSGAGTLTATDSSSTGSKTTKR